MTNAPVATDLHDWDDDGCEPSHQALPQTYHVMNGAGCLRT